MKDKRFYSKIGKKGIKLRWQRFHSTIKTPKSLTPEKASLHAYLCGDGNICIRKDKLGNRKHYEIRFFPDDKLMLENIRACFLRCYGIQFPSIKRIGKMFYARVNNKIVCKDLLELGKYGTHDWNIPKEISKKFAKTWIACYFDCEAHVNKKSRYIQVKSVNQKGLNQVKKMLDNLNIKSSLNGPYNQKIGSSYYVLTITTKGMENYAKEIGFNNSEKVKRLNSVLNSRPDGPMVRRK